MSAARASPEACICAPCRARLAAAVPRGIAVADSGFAGGPLWALAAVPYTPPATGLVAALKSGRVPAVATLAAELLAEALGPLPADAVLVPVGAAALRRLRRGLDPAEEIALALAARVGVRCRPGLLVRRGGRPQRGRGRAERLADPPEFVLRGRPPAHAVIVDDVLTTGATIGSCARSLEDAGAHVGGALAFAWAPTPGSRPEGGRGS